MGRTINCDGFINVTFQISLCIISTALPRVPMTCACFNYTLSESTTGIMNTDETHSNSTTFLIFLTLPETRYRSGNLASIV